MSARSSKGVERRNFLTGIGVAGGAVALGSATTLVARKSVAASASAGASNAPAATTNPRTRQPAVHVEPPAGPEVMALFGSLGAGSQIDRWSIVAVHSTRMGAIPVTMATANGDLFQVDVVRRDADLPGVGNSARLSVFLVNSGDGTVATTEEQGLGAMALAAALARREAEGATVPTLLTLRERNARFPRGAYKAVV